MLSVRSEKPICAPPRLRRFSNVAFQTRMALAFETVVRPSGKHDAVPPPLLLLLQLQPRGSRLLLRGSSENDASETSPSRSLAQKNYASFFLRTRWPREAPFRLPPIRHEAPTSLRHDHRSETMPFLSVTALPSHSTCSGRLEVTAIASC